MRKPRVITRCVANHYSGQSERIVEFAGSKAGGLIAIRECESGALRIDVYRCGGRVVVGVTGTPIDANTIEARREDER